MQQRWAMGVAYQGGEYHGWASQPNLPTIQQSVEAAISQCADQAVAVQCAGRTDRGVHATSQVIHFDISATRTEKALYMGVNSLLPSDIRIQWVKPVDAAFHARYSAVARRYLYCIYRADWAPCEMNRFATHIRWPLCIESMQAAAQHLLGEHDFSAFRGSDCQSKSPVRTVNHLNCIEAGAWLIVDIEANAFVMHMVRNIVGCLFEVGRGRQPVDWLQTVLASRDRRCAAAMAPANGLYLASVNYGDMSLPCSSLSLPWFINNNNLYIHKDKVNI